MSKEYDLKKQVRLEDDVLCMLGRHAKSLPVPTTLPKHVNGLLRGVLTKLTKGAK